MSTAVRSSCMGAILLLLVGACLQPTAALLSPTQFLQNFCSCAPDWHCSCCIPPIFIMQQSLCLHINVRPYDPHLSAIIAYNGFNVYNTDFGAENQPLICQSIPLLPVTATVCLQVSNFGTYTDFDGVRNSTRVHICSNATLNINNHHTFSSSLGCVDLSPGRMVVSDTGTVGKFTDRMNKFPNRMLTQALTMLQKPDMYQAFNMLQRAIMFPGLLGQAMNMFQSPVTPQPEVIPSMRHLSHVLNTLQTFMPAATTSQVGSMPPREFLTKIMRKFHKAFIPAAMTFQAEITPKKGIKSKEVNTPETKIIRPAALTPQTGTMPTRDKLPQEVSMLTTIMPPATVMPTTPPTIPPTTPPTTSSTGIVPQESTPLTTAIPPTATTTQAGAMPTEGPQTTMKPPAEVKL